MIRVITKHNMATNAQYVAGFAALRHRVFVERLGWDLSSPSRGFEYDRYDNSDAIYMVVCNDDDVVVAGLRLLSTTCPFLLADCCPELAKTGAIPVGETIWEVTRFVVDPCPVRTAGCRDLTIQLVWALQSYGLARGFSRFVSVSYAGMERLLRAVGCRFSRLAAPHREDGRTVVPLEFEISEQVLASVERRLLTARGPTQPAAIPNQHGGADRFADDLAPIEAVVANLVLNAARPPTLVS